MTWCTCRRGLSGLLVALVLSGGVPARAQTRSWRVLLSGADVTASARAIDAGGVLLVDVAALAASLGLVVRADARQVVVRDPEGTQWQGLAGSSELSGPRGEMPLDRPLRVENRSVYLPAATAAALAGLTLTLDREAMIARLERPADHGDQAAPAGWSTFSIAKPRGSAASQTVDADVGAAAPDLLPPAHDSLRAGAAVTHVLGADWGAELDAAGRWNGFDTRLTGHATQGTAGLEMTHGFFGLYQPEKWGVEAGNLFSEIWGSAVGVRWLGRERGGAGARPAFSLYLPVGPGASGGTVLAVAEELALGRSSLLGGELATDGSWLLRGHYQRGRFGLFAFGREAAGSGLGMGAGGSLELPAGLGLQADWNHSGGAEAIDSRDLALLLHLGRGGELTLEGTAATGERTRQDTAALRYGLTLGPARFRASYQQRDLQILFDAARRGSVVRQELLAGTSYAVGRRVRLDLLAVFRGPGRTWDERWGQLAANLRLFSHTTIVLVATSAGAPLRDPLHLRIEQGLAHGLSLFAEYGRISSFQGFDDGVREPMRFKLTVRKVWDVPTPPAGGEVQGRVTSAGEALGPGLPVQLGPYRRATDEHGAFAFRHLPPGSYDLAIPPRSVPAAFTAPPPAQLTVTGREHKKADVALVPLGVVAGWVTLDGNGGGRPGPARHLVSGVVVRLDDQVTAAAADGSFSFHNVVPGTHRLSIDVDHLPQRVAVTVPSRIELGLPPGGRLEDVRFRLVVKEKPLLFQKTEKP
jgi:hypothetical protein